MSDVLLFHNKRLESLVVDTPINNEGIKHLCDALMNNKTLSSLTINYLYNLHFVFRIKKTLK